MIERLSFNIVKSLGLIRNCNTGFLVLKDVFVCYQSTTVKSIKPTWPLATDELSSKEAPNYDHAKVISCSEFRSLPAFGQVK